MHLASGLFAVMWSCGYIAYIAELFGSEGCAQVYVHLVNFFSRLCLHMNTSNTAMMMIILHRNKYFPKVLCYDDACHLVRYARNRKDESDIARSV